MAAAPKPTEPTQAVAAAIGSLTIEQCAKLDRIAAKYAWKAGWSPEELLQEAASRAIAGDRRCPVGLGIEPFLAEVMRGIADDESNKGPNAAVHVPIERGGGREDLGVVVADPTPTAESALISEEEAAAIREEIMTIFKDDSVIVNILDGIMFGYSASEICELFDIDITTYNSKRRQIRRVLDKTFPNRRKP